MRIYLRGAMLALMWTCTAYAAPIATVVTWDGLDRAAWRVDAESDWQWFAPHQQQPFTAGDTAYQVMLDPTPGVTQSLLVLAVEGLPVPLRFSVTGPYLDKPVVLTFYPPEPVQFIPLPDITHAAPPRVPEVAAVPEPSVALMFVIATVFYLLGWWVRRLSLIIRRRLRRAGQLGKGGT